MAGSPVTSWDTVEVGSWFKISVCTVPGSSAMILARVAVGSSASPPTGLSSAAW